MSVVCCFIFCFILTSKFCTHHQQEGQNRLHRSCPACAVYVRDLSFNFVVDFFLKLLFFFASISHHLKTSFAVHRITRTRGSLVSMCVCTKSTQSEYERAKKYTPHNGRLLPQTFLFLPPPKKAQSLSRPVQNHRMTEVRYKMRLTYSISPCEVVR